MSRTPLAKDVALLAGLFTTSGVVHLVRPKFFKPMVPTWVPAPDEVILWSGVAELVCAGGLLAPATRRPAGWASAALLVGVFPGNVKMAMDAMRTRSTRYKAIALARLPLQLPLVNAALKAARR
ncbi:MAG TPA: DoxX family protein [Marmoricola sp.]|nr:DoxX family protein [Marmoricola sp.]